MIEKAEFERLLNYEAKEKSSVLSVYLERDPAWHKSTNHKGKGAFKVLLQNLQRNLGPQEADSLSKNARAIESFLNDFMTSGWTVVIFADVSQGFFWAKELKIKIPSQIHWREKPYLLPLLEAFDEYERYGVILADKAHARFFTFFLGEIEEEQGAVAWNDVQNIKVTGRDNLGSQRQLERTHQMHTEWLLKLAAEKMRELAKRYPFERLILGGSREIANEMENLLPPFLKSKVAGKVLVPVRATEKEIREALIPFEKEVERKTEMTVVEKLMTAARNPEQAILGMHAVKNSVKKNRIRKLVYAAGWSHDDGVCPSCGAVYHEKTALCRTCRLELEPAEDLLEEAACSVVKTGGAIEKVSSEAAEKLNSCGGVGAFLWGT